MRPSKALLLISAFLFVAAVAFSGARAEKEKEKVAAFSAVEELNTLDPQAHMNTTVFYVQRHMFDPLIERSATGELKPALAVKWEYLDQHTLKLDLRQGVKFHNGEEFTSESVKYTIERVKDPEMKSPGAHLWRAIKSVETPSKHTATIRTESPVGPLLVNLNLLEMLPPEAGKSKDFASNPVGTGPYQFVEWVRGSHVTMKRFDDCWRGAPKLDKLVYRELREVSTRMSALETGEIQVAVGVPAQEVKRLQRANVTIVPMSAPKTRFLSLNSRRAPFNDVRVRQAVQMGINTAVIVQHVMEGYGKQADAPLPPGVFGRTDKLSPVKHDPAKARQLLAEAGYPNGFETTLNVSEISVGFLDIAAVIQSQLAEIGIKVNILNRDRAVWVEHFTKEDYDMNLANTVTLTGDADFTLGRLWISETSFVGYHGDDEVDRYLLMGRTSVDLPTRQAAYEKAQQLMWERAAGVFLFFEVEIYGIGPNVIGFEPRPDGYIDLRFVDLKE